MLTKKRMAVIASLDYRSWPMGGMLNYIMNILPDLEKHYNLELWGVTVDGKEPSPIRINGRIYNIKILANVKTKHKMIPNYFRVLLGTFCKVKEIDKQKYHVIYFHASPLSLIYTKFRKNFSSLVVNHQHGLSASKIAQVVPDKAAKGADLNLVNSDMQSIVKWAIRLNCPLTNFEQATGQVDRNIFKLTPNMHSIKNQLHISAKHVFIYAGRITAHKNPIWMIDAFCQYLNTVQEDSMLILIGDGDLFDTVRSLVQKKQLTEKVKLPGRLSQQDIAKCLQIADVYLMLSKGEGCSLSVAEAFACGLPTVCFNVVGLRGQVEHCKTGYIADFGDIDGVTKGMMYCIDNQKNLLPNIIASAKKYDSSYVSSKIIEDIDERIKNEN